MKFELMKRSRWVRGHRETIYERDIVAKNATARWLKNLSLHAVILGNDEGLKIRIVASAGDEAHCHSPEAKTSYVDNCADVLPAK